MHRLRRLVVTGIALASAGLGLLTSGARADSPPIGGGTYLASGSRVTSTIGTLYDSVEVDGDGNVTKEDDDKDVYVFEGYAGQTVTISAKAPRGSALLPLLDIFAPDGRQIAVEDGLRQVPRQPAAPRKSAKLIFKLDQSGTWSIRVRGQFPGKVLRGDNPATTDVVETNYRYVQYDYSTFKDTEGHVRTQRTKGDYVLSVRYRSPRNVSFRNAVPGEDGFYRFEVPASGGATVSGVLTFRGGTPTFVTVLDPTGRDLKVPPSYATTVVGRKVSITPVILPRSSVIGPFTFVFQANPTASTRVTFRPKVILPKDEKPLKVRLAADEPLITSIDPPRGGPDITLTVKCTGLSDPASQDKPRVFLSRIEVDPDDITVQTTGNTVSLVVTTPTESDLPLGTYDLKVTSSTGQAAVVEGGFQVVEPPRGDSISPSVGSSSGGYVVTINGARFNTSKLGGKANGMKIGFRQPNTGSTFEPQVQVNVYSSTKLDFTMPPIPVPGLYEVYVIDSLTQRRGKLLQQFLATETVSISDVTPALVPTLGGETIYIRGSNFLATDEVYIETAPGSDTYEKFTGTYFSKTRHQLSAPVRTPGTYRVYIYDPTNTYSTATRSFAYYRFQDYSPDLGITGSDGFDGWTTALADMDKDGDLDLFVSRRGTGTLATSSQTRVLRHKGVDAQGNFKGFEDVTAVTMPAPASDDDWRAERIRVSDLNGDGYPDIVIVTDHASYPKSDEKSHVRLLMNERRSSGSDVSERAFRDRTADLMAPLRKMTRLYGSSGKNEMDDWKGKDLWVGDLDAANVGPPEIVITGENVFENYYVSCTPYCASPYSGGYTYSFYWGGTRVFRWDQTARAGLGRYKFDANYFPRKSGITVAIFNPPPGIKVPTCSPNQCRGTFTPFTGQRLAVGPLDEDGKPDIAVLNSKPVMREGNTISSLQVGINVFHSGASVWDVTDDMTGLGESDFMRGNTLAIGTSGFPDGFGLGLIAVAKDDPTNVTGSALRMVRYLPTPDRSADPGNFDLVTTDVLPAAGVEDRFHASDIAFVDIDGDSDDDLLLLARTPPNGSGSGFRIFRNETVNGKAGVFTKTLSPLIDTLLTATEHYEGDSLAVGDLDGDKAYEFLMTLATTGSHPSPFTRAIRTER